MGQAPGNQAEQELNFERVCNFIRNTYCFRTLNDGNGYCVFWGTYIQIR